VPSSSEEQDVGRAHVGGSRGIIRSSQILTNNTLV
jgi:hypothetical protein